MLQLYMDLASSRLACRDIQRIQLYSYTAIHAIQHTALYSVPQVKKKPAEQQRPVAAFRDAVRASVRITIRGQGLRITS